MKNILIARFLIVLAIAMVFSNCAGSNEPFFRYNSPFVDRNRPVAPDNFGSGSAASSGAGDIGDPGLPKLSANAEQKDDGGGPVESPGSTPEADTPATAGTAGTAGSPATPEIFVHKPGPAGSMCYTCRGKGYVLMPTTDAAGDVYTCPACGGDGRN